MENRRIKYYDVLRILSFLLVILYHMLVQLYLDGIVVPLEAVSRYFQNANMHIATLAVSLFFMLSGAGLTLSAEKGFSLKQYYKNRFLRLMVPFYIALLGFYGCTLALTGRLPGIFYVGVPKWRYIFTLSGLDGWLAMHGYLTFTVGIGEWFLGALILLTLLFPLLRLGMDRCPGIFLGACTGLFLLVAFRGGFAVEDHMNLILKGYEFVLGMALARYFKRIPVPLALLGALALGAFLFSPAPLPLNNALKILLCALCAFVAASGLEPLLQKRRLKALAKAQAYSYPLFLVHHKVIDWMTPRFAPYYSGPLSVAVFFMLELVVMGAAAAVLQFLSTRAVRLLDGGKWLSRNND